MLPSSLRTRLLRLGAVAVVGGAAVSVVLRRVRPLPPPLAASAAEPSDAGLEEWCADLLTPAAGGGCLAAPARDAGPVPLLVYLHGRYSPITLAEERERQDRVARLSVARGFAVLSLRGVQGECTQPELADTWCWPSNPRVEGDGPKFVARFEPAIAATRERIGPGPTVLLGFSNGAYFATLIATRGLRPFDAIAIAHGGPVPPTRALGPAPPLLLITADDDPSDGEMQQLHDELTRERWAHEFVGREGGHALPDWDVNIALTFFTRALKEPLPLDPPLQPPRARPTPPPTEEPGTDEAGSEPDATEPTPSASAEEPGADDP